LNYKTQQYKEWLYSHSSIMSSQKLTLYAVHKNVREGLVHHMYIIQATSS